jgi:hypothetical protein
MLHAERLVPSKLDPAFSQQREEAFIPWSDPEQSGAYWKKLSSSNIPIYNERKAGNLSRDIYTPNPGTGYWVLGGLTEKALFKTHKEKLLIDDTLISASTYTDEKGETSYWALWAPRSKAHFLTERMSALGIAQARIEYSLFDKLNDWAVSLNTYTGALSFSTLLINLVIMLLLVALTLKIRKHNNA